MLHHQLRRTLPDLPMRGDLYFGLATDCNSISVYISGFAHRQLRRHLARLTPGGQHAPVHPVVVHEPRLNVRLQRLHMQSLPSNAQCVLNNRVLQRYEW